MRSLVVCWLLLAPLVNLAGAEPPEGMVLVPAGDFVMGRDDSAFDEAPAHRVHVSAFYMDRSEVTNSQFATFVRESQCYEAVEGPWFRHCAQACLDLVAHYQQKHGLVLDDLSATAPRETDASQRQRQIDAARWRAAIMALRDMLGPDVKVSTDMAMDRISTLPTVGQLLESQAKHPVRSVTWRDAQSYARWAGKRLPTEAEWERAARGDDDRNYPWGNTWNPDNCRTGLTPPLAAVFAPKLPDRTDEDPADVETGPAPVGSYPAGASPYGCLDMAGNVWEWTADWYGEWYYVESQNAENPPGPAGLADGQLPGPYSDGALLRTPQQGRSTDTRKVLRGGGWAGPSHFSPFNTRTTRRLWSNPGYAQADVGFRCALDVGDSSLSSAADVQQP